MKSRKAAVKALILAGGYSKRIHLATPKQLVKINGRPLLAVTLDIFNSVRAIESIVLVINKKFSSQCHKLVNDYGYKKIEKIVLGGKSRQESVFNGLRNIKNCDYVVIHDSVRPFVTKKMVSNMIQAVKKYDAVTYAVGAIDTIVEAKDNLMSKVFRRDRIFNIQTPQAFKFDLILNAHNEARAAKVLNSSDDAQLVLKFGAQVKILEGGYQNLKITTSFDLRLAKLLLQKRR